MFSNGNKERIYYCHSKTNFKGKKLILTVEKKRIIDLS